MSFGGKTLSQRFFSLYKNNFRYSDWTCFSCQHKRAPQRFSTSARARQEQQQNTGPFSTSLRTALRNTKVQWKYRIPIGLGIGFLGAAQFYRVQEREKRRHREEQDALESTEDNKGKPRKRKHVRPSGPW